MMLKNILAQQFPKRLVDVFVQAQSMDKAIKQYNDDVLKTISDIFQNWQFWPQGTEGDFIVFLSMESAYMIELEFTFIRI